MTITLKLKDRIVEFTPEEALAVYRELNEMFGCNSESVRMLNEWVENIKTPPVTNPMPFGPWRPGEIIC